MRLMKNVRNVILFGMLFFSTFKWLVANVNNVQYGKLLMFLAAPKKVLAFHKLVAYKKQGVVY